jgi:hypothetical protein
MSGVIGQRICAKVEVEESKQTSGTARMSTGSGVNTDGIVVVTSLRQ